MECGAIIRYQDVNYELAVYQGVSFAHIRLHLHPTCQIIATTASMAESTVQQRVCTYVPIHSETPIYDNERALSHSSSASVAALRQARYAAAGPLAADDERLVAVKAAFNEAHGPLPPVLQKLYER